MLERHPCLPGCSLTRFANFNSLSDRAQGFIKRETLGFVIIASQLPLARGRQTQPRAHLIVKPCGQTQVLITEAVTSAA